MNRFKDFNITVESKAFVGDKIKIDRILNREITVHDFKIEKSKYDRGNGQCLYIQISVGENKHVLFTGSANLMELIKQVPETGFPFQTTIVKENERLQFT